MDYARKEADCRIKAGFDRGFLLTFSFRTCFWYVNFELYITTSQYWTKSQFLIIEDSIYTYALAGALIAQDKNL